MTSPYMTLEGVSCLLPDGRTLFSELNEHFDARHTGLVGRNGIGKSVLARILAGEIAPSSGTCLRSGVVYYLAQQVSVPDDATVADLAGVGSALNALTRIEAGSAAVADFEALGERWDIRQRLQQALEHDGLAYVDAMTPASQLSGGEAMRVALIGAALAHADFLILDEPTNHLDQPSRQALIERLQRWPGGVLVISHDRQLLETMEAIVALTSHGLRRYGGSYTFYAQRQAQERDAAHQQLEQCRVMRKREERVLQQQRERQERRQGRGRREGKSANQARVLLDRQKARSEGASGRLQQQHRQAREQLARREREAAQQVEHEAAIHLHALPQSSATHREVARLEQLVLPFVSHSTCLMTLSMTGQQRIGVTGPNGCGKSTLLRVMAGHLQPLGGRCCVTANRAWLDQRLASLAPECSVLAHMQAVSRMTEGEIRMRLAQLDLEASKIMMPSGALSGGERLKAALAGVLYADPPPPLLLLDEPGNHLDIESLEALERMLRAYQGALMVVSHDAAFLDSLNLTHALMANETGWQLKPWP
ncbi:ATPase components of ABC transporters with duplicated ATPase domains [Kushneria avicenniae]|uniref:ATPase components of ABC transporters with duplicated ATPase domains n=1 Tax=Kushneria avicenniae TaxID=402385 RepID=A0A1I1JJ63_9GAMM|nr:ATP-binding cassette domain-containing protein [Kushneria avicenniae]SFC48594.1 ATPase components of ABC transporters with duplicated ATPase domains [Kushneria avicenniae]